MHELQTFEDEFINPFNDVGIDLTTLSEFNLKPVFT